MIIYGREMEMTFMNCSESKVHDILQKAFPLLPPIMKMFLLGYLEGLAEMGQNESPYISQRPALLYHSREAGGNRKSWEFVIFSIVNFIAILDCNVAFFELPTLQNDCKYDMAISSEFPGNPKKYKRKPPRP